MVTIEEAQRTILEQITPLETEKVSVLSGLNMVTPQDHIAPWDIRRPTIFKSMGRRRLFRLMVKALLQKQGANKGERPHLVRGFEMGEYLHILF